MRSNGWILGIGMLMLMAGCNSESKKTVSRIYHQAMRFGDYGTAIYAIHTALANPESGRLKATISGDKTEYNVPLVAQLYNFLGNLKEKAGDKDSAIFAYSKAVSIDPEFKIADDNLKSLKDKEPVPGQ